MKSTQEIARELNDALEALRLDYTDNEKADRVRDLTEELQSRRLQNKSKRERGKHNAKTIRV